MRLKPAKFKPQEPDTRFLLEGKVSKKDEYLLNALEEFEHKRFACLVPFELRRKRDRVTAVFNTQSLVALPVYLHMPMEEDQFIALLESLLRAFAEVDELSVRYEDLRLKPDDVYVNAIHGSMSFLLCGPDPKDAPSPMGLELFHTVGKGTKAATYEVREIVSDYLAGLDHAAARGLAAYRAYVSEFVRRARGTFDQNEHEVKTPTYELPASIFYRPEKPTTFQGGVDFIELIHLPQGRRIRVDRFPFVLGASEGADYQVDDCAWVSRRHAEIRMSDGVVVVSDLDSTNGTSINGRELPSGSSARVEDGDKIDLAGALFSVSIGARNE